jgi:ABC-2 type transport system ATP-binding protein
MLVAQALVHKPPVIVLDEPTAGVDVELRLGLWQFVRRLNRDGHTIVLTTHYLEEAEAHCQRIAMLKAGRVVALDSTHNLLQSFSGAQLSIRLEDGTRNDVKLQRYEDVEGVLARLRESGARIVEMELQPPDLEEVFIRLTGKSS